MCNNEYKPHLDCLFFLIRQEAILAAMSEKDANIALLEMTSSKKQKNTEEIEKLNKEKEKLQQQLSEVVKFHVRFSIHFTMKDVIACSYMPLL